MQFVFQCDASKRRRCKATRTRTSAPCEHQLRIKSFWVVNCGDLYWEYGQNMMFKQLIPEKKKKGRALCGLYPCKFSKTNSEATALRGASEHEKEKRKKKKTGGGTTSAWAGRQRSKSQIRREPRSIKCSAEWEEASWQDPLGSRCGAEHSFRGGRGMGGAGVGGRAGGRGLTDQTADMTEISGPNM